MSAHSPESDALSGLSQKASLPDPREDTTVPDVALLFGGSGADDREMKAFVAGWFSHARNPERLVVEDAWRAYRLVESGDACRTEVVDGQAVRVRGTGEWDGKDREAFAHVVRAASDLLLFHTHNEWTGMCACGEGPFTRPEWAAHVSKWPEGRADK